MQVVQRTHVEASELQTCICGSVLRTMQQLYYILGTAFSVILVSETFSHHTHSPEVVYCQGLALVKLQKADLMKTGRTTNSPQKFTVFCESQQLFPFLARPMSPKWAFARA